MNVYRHEAYKTDNVYRPYFIMELKLLPWQELLISAVMMLVLILVVVHFNVPNPNMILIAGLVICSALFCYGGAVVAGVIRFFYTLYFFSTGHSFTEFTPENLQKVGVSLVGIAVDMVFVCALKRAEMHAFAQVDDLTEELLRRALEYGNKCGWFCVQKKGAISSLPTRAEVEALP